MLRAMLILVGVVLLAVAGVYGYRRATFDREAWREDFAQLIEHTSRTYANLDWAPARGVSLPELRVRTEDAIDHAKSDDEAREAIVAFAEAFHDPHYLVPRVKLSKRMEKWWRELRTKPAAQAGPLSRTLAGDEAAAALGFGSKGLASRFEFSEQAARTLPAPRPADEEFPTMVLRLRDGRSVGVVRIGSFSETSYPLNASVAWDGFKAALTKDCDDDCQEDFVYRVVPNALLASLTRRIEQLQQEKVDAIAVDVTGNGGGTDWAEAAARLFAKAPVRCARMAAVKHPHWTGRFEETRNDFDQALKAATLSEADRKLIVDARDRAERLRAETATPCDRAPLWEPGGKVSCKGVTQTELFACGYSAYLPPGTLQGVEIRTHLDNTLAYQYQPGAWSGPLLVITDDHTASASELFVAMLVDSGGAKAVGERTLGAGCGYTNGGVPAKLRHSGLEVKMPDCARLRADGTSEIEGILPAIAVSWAETAHERGDQLVAALEGAPLAQPEPDAGPRAP